MRFAILGISHETNTFSRVPADYHQFEMADLLRGDEIVKQFESALYTTAGYLQAARDFGFEAVPLMWAQTGPIGTITKDAYDRITAEMFQMLRVQGPWDAVLLPNHGAAV
ncbi:MAG: M81 family metallopeptidase, partial [Chloroflexi bacterium]|nr:M81 family metallopeptidase [Chloroflexota bacterium]